MKLTAALPLLPLLLTGMTTALPSTSGLNQIRFPVPDGMTVEQGSSKCGDQAQLSCCNEADYAGDTTKVADGLAAGLLSNLIGGGSSADGLGLFSQCSKLNVRLLIAPGDILNRKCKQNIVCCAKSEHSASHDLVGASLPCIALGSLV